MNRKPPRTLVAVGSLFDSLSPEQLMRAQADLAELAFGSFAAPEAGASATPHLAFLPPDQLALDLSDPLQCELGDYTLIEKLGQGGMGVVYRARQNSLDREVALKLLSAGPWASRDFIERFRREAQSAARMQHPNIVAIYEIGHHEELNFFSMRLVRGPSLAHQLAERGPLPARATAQLLRTVAEAVDYAHRLGVLHLDLKPGNVLIDEHSQPMVADFGLARRMDESLGHECEEVSGTPSYMAPEQAQLKSYRLSAATDIYGLGAILYEVLCGQPPFLGSTPQETLLRVVTLQPAPPRTLRSNIPADLEAICLKCLAKTPSERYPSARALADDLANYLAGRAVSVRRPGSVERLTRWARREPRVAIASAAFVAALATGLAATAQQWQRAESNAEASRSLLWEGRREAALRLAGDGKAYEALPRLLANIEEQQRDGATAQAEMERRRIGILLGQGATLIDRMAIADANPLAVELSTDGSVLALAMNDQSVRWYDAQTLVERGRVSLAERSSSNGQPRAPLLLRFIDARRLMVTLEWYSNLVSPTNGDSWLIDLERGELLQPPAAFADFADASFSADGRYALLRNQHRQAQLWQLEPWRPLSALTSAQADFQPWLIDPRGRFAVRLTVAMRHLEFHALPALTATHTVGLPRDAGVSAWAISGDGAVLALGDFEGRVFLLDTGSLVVRPLPTSRGREVTWLSFSEDDSWLATASFDGAVHAFEVASGDTLVAGQMRHDFALQRVGLSRQQRLLVVAGEGQTALWRLSLPGPRAVPAQRIAAGPAAHGLSGRYAAGWSLSAGLLASAGMDGQVRLWRLPLPALQTARASRQVAESLRFDGRHLVDVEWDRARVVSIAKGAPSAWLSLPQPPGFAELVDDGRTLLLSAGPQLRVYDGATLRPRAAPIDLPNSPQRLLASADGSRVVLGFGNAGEAGFEERLMLYDTRNGHLLSRAVALAGPLQHMAFSADATRIVAVGPAEGATVVMDASNLARIGEYPHDPYQPVQWADFSATGAELHMVTRATDPRLGSDSLLTWNPATDRIVATQASGSTRPLGVVALPTGVFVAGNRQDLRYVGDGTASVDRAAQSEPTAVLALSPDRRLLARGFRREVQLYAADSGVLVGAPLVSDSDAMDGITHLAFSPDGGRLLGRTVHGFWLLWPVAAEARAAAALLSEVDRLSPRQEDHQVLRVPSTAERQALRARDSGAWSAPDARPMPALAATTRAGLAIPLRSAGLPAQLIDLGPHYDISPESVRNTFYSITPAMRPLPAGVQRISGIDFDLRGMLQIGVLDDGAAPGTAPASELHCLNLPARPFAALHLLLRVSSPSPAASGSVLANIRLHYADGGSAPLPLRAGHEVPGYAGDDSNVPWAFGTDRLLAVLGLPAEVFSAPRLANPWPERPVRCLDIDTAQSAGPLLLLGITLEATPEGGGDATPVIDRGASGSTIQQSTSTLPAAIDEPTAVRSP